MLNIIWRKPSSVSLLRRSAQHCFNYEAQLSLCKCSCNRGIFLADDHSGVAFYVLQSVWVKIHQEPPHPSPHRRKGELDLHLLAWCYIPTEKEQINAFPMLSNVCKKLGKRLQVGWQVTRNNQTKIFTFSWENMHSLLTWHRREWLAAAQHPPRWRRHPSVWLVRDSQRRWTLLSFPRGRLFLAPEGERPSSPP